MMKKMICLLVLLVMCASLVMPVLATGAAFVPSIGYKDGPGIDEAEMDGEDVDQCVIVSTIQQAKEKLTDISQEDRDLLQAVYEALKDGSMTLPVDFDYVIRDLLDVSFEYIDCRMIDEHNNKPLQLKEEGVTLTITFDMDLGVDEKVTVLTFIEDEATRSGEPKGNWVPVESAVNNGDGTLTVVFEDICPVVFLVEQTEDIPTPPTGDAAGKWLILAVGLMVISAAAIIVLLTTKSRKTH